MYRIAEIIENDGAPSIVGEISFHPSGSYFAATYESINEVRIYDSRTRKLLQVLSNPECQFDDPHGVLFSEKYLLISNKHGFKKPGTINVYRNGGTITEPIQVFQTPFDHLREPHTLAMRDGRLVSTYCENLAPSGAVVCYGFNEETGNIIGPIDKTETWFSQYGDCKGVCFNAEGTKILVTFESDKYLSFFNSISYRTVKKRLKKVFKQLRSFHPTWSNTRSGKRKPKGQIQTLQPNKNGVAIFSINSEGKIARNPDNVALRGDFCRLENIHLYDNTCVITDVVNRSLSLYDLTQDPKFRNPVQTVKLGNGAPHGAKFSPDGRLLVISCLGLKIKNQKVQFFDWASPREDKIYVFERAAPESPRSQAKRVNA